jgi:hypothetical protein
MDTPGYRTLKQIVKDIHFEGGYGLENWKYIGQFALNAIRDLHMFHTKKYKIAKVTVDIQTNTIDWPDDYVGLCYLGIPTADGRIWTLTRKNELITTTTLVNGQETLNSEQGEGVIPIEGQIVGYAATGGKNSFYYSEDEVNRRFFLIGANPINIILGYISSGVTDKDTVIPIRFKEAIINYVRWKIKLREPIDYKGSDYFKDLYEQECNKLIAFEDPTLDELYDALLSEYSGTYTR